MGEAFNRAGQFLGSASGATKADVLEQLVKAHGDNAHEIRIRTLEENHAGATAQMPQYRSHKTVSALKIRAVTLNSVLAALSGNESDGSAVITPEDEGYGDFRVDAAYLRKHDPQAGGYYVRYSDGYESFSPAAAFEEGYTRI